MEIYKAKLGADHSDALVSMISLTVTYMNQSRWKEAEPLNMQVMETYKRKLSADHPFILITMGNLISTYMNRGQWEEAEQL